MSIIGPKVYVNNHLFVFICTIRQITYRIPLFMVKRVAAQPPLKFVNYSGVCLTSLGTTVTLASVKVEL